jgi:hypothetical protein
MLPMRPAVRSCRSRAAAAIRSRTGSRDPARADRRMRWACAGERDLMGPAGVAQGTQLIPVPPRTSATLGGPAAAHRQRALLSVLGRHFAHVPVESPPQACGRRRRTLGEPRADSPPRAPGGRGDYGLPACSSGCADGHSDPAGLSHFVVFGRRRRCRGHRSPARHVSPAFPEEQE